MTQSIRLCISALFSLSHFLTDSFPTRKAEMGLCDRKHSLADGPSLGLTGTFDPLGEELALDITSSAGPGQRQHAMGRKQSRDKLQGGRGGGTRMSLPLGSRCLERWGQANSPRGSTLNWGSMPALPLLPAWERPAASVFAFVLKTTEPSWGTSLKMKCSTVRNCVPRSPGSRYLTSRYPELPIPHFSIALGLGGSSPSKAAFPCFSDCVQHCANSKKSLPLPKAALHRVGRCSTSCGGLKLVQQHVCSGHREVDKKRPASCHHLSSPAPQLSLMPRHTQTFF